MVGIIEDLGRVHGFLEFEIRCKRSTDVKSPVELMSYESVENLVRWKLGHHDLDSVPIYSDGPSEADMSSTSQPADVLSDMIQSLLSSIKTVSVSIEEKLSCVKDLVAELVVEKHTVADDFTNKLADKFLEIQEKEAKIEADKLNVMSDVFDRQVGNLIEVRSDLEVNSDRMNKIKDMLEYFTLTMDNVLKSASTNIKSKATHLGDARI